MDKTVARSNSRNTIKTDLSLLLECLKVQMKCPDLQKQALLTIHSICEKREDNVDLLREMGGVSFVYNLSKSSIVHSDVKETAIFTLGTLAEANVYCKNSLCRKETFAVLGSWLMKEDIPLTQKRVSVYLLSVLVANNKTGQTLAQTTGCLDILLDLFRTSFPLSIDATSVVANATHTYQLWASVSSALCGCVNNPQNEEGQHICIAAFPIIKIWLQQIALPCPEIFQSICSFIAMTVANNSCVQESFSASGSLETLTLSLVRLAPMADTSLLSCQVSVAISKTLSACITDNSALASGLAQYGIVPHLFSLLASPNLDLEDRLSVLLTLGYCTVASEEHQSQLVQCGGLPLIITLLAEDTSEEVRKAATFILQTCKQATISLGMPSLIARHGEYKNEEPLSNMESFKSSARELLYRIDQLEKKQAKKAEDEQEDTDRPTSAKKLVLPSLSPVLPLPLQRKESIKTIPTAYRQTSTHKHIEAGGENSIKLHTVRNIVMNEKDDEMKKISSNSSTREEKAETSGRDEWYSVCKHTGALMSFHVKSLEGGRELHTADSLLFKPPAPVRHSVPNEIKCSNEEDLQDQEMSKVGKIIEEEHSFSHSRCAGCVLPFEKVTSRNFAFLQSSGCNSCDMHKALKEATEKFRNRHCNLLFQREYQDNTVELTDHNSERVSAAEPRKSQKYWGRVCLTPINKGSWISKSSLTGHHCNKLKEELKGRHALLIRRSQRKRKDFSLEEVCNLLRGVKTFGFSWNSILWSYPFHPGHTTVDLAKKFRKLMRAKTQDAGSEES